MGRKGEDAGLFKRAEVNSDRVLDVFVKEKRESGGDYGTKKMKLDEWLDKPLHGQYPS